MEFGLRSKYADPKDLDWLAWTEVENHLYREYGGRAFEGMGWMIYLTPLKPRVWKVQTCIHHRNGIYVLSSIASLDNDIFSLLPHQLGSFLTENCRIAMQRAEYDYNRLQYMSLN